MVNDLQERLRWLGRPICVIDPGYSKWGIAYAATTDHYTLRTEACNSNGFDHVCATLETLYSRYVFDVVGVEETYHGRASRKIVSGLDQCVGIVRFWSWNMRAELHVIPVLNGWKHDLGLAGMKPKQIRDRCCEEIIEVRTDHEACAVFMMDWLTRRLEARERGETE